MPHLLLSILQAQPAFGEAHGDGFPLFLGVPSDFTSVFNDILNHVRAKYARALGNHHLTTRVLVEFDTDFHTTLSAAFCPPVL